MKAVWFLILFLPFTVQAKFIPEDFKFLYEEQELLINFELPNDIITEVNVIGNFDGIIRFLNKDGFISKLIESGIKKDRIESVIKKLTNKQCVEETCNDINIQFDYDNKYLKIEVSASLLDESNNSDPYTRLPSASNGIISNNVLVGNYASSSVNASYTNETIVGMGRGYLDAGFTLDQSGGQSQADLEKLYYYHNFPGMRVNLGYSEYSGVSNDNATNMLDFSNVSDRFFVSIGSSNNLLKLKKEQYKRLYFDLKNKGLVRFFRDGKLVKSNYYPQGQNYVSFDQLPRGNYDLTIILKPEGGIEEKLVKRINNNSNDFSINDQDFNLVAMNFDLNEEEFSKDSLSVGELSYASRFDNGMVFGATTRASSIGNEVGLYTGIEVDKYSASLFLSSGQDSLFFNSSLSFGMLSVDYQKFDNNSEDNLMSALYGVDSYQQWSANYGFDLFDGNLNFYINDMYRLDDTLSFRNLNSSISYSKTIFGDIDWSLNYTNSMNTDTKITNYENKFEENSISMNFIIPLNNDGTRFTSNFQYSDRARSTFVNTLDSESIYEENGLTVDGSLSSTINGNNSQYGLSANYRKNSNYYTSDGYFNYDSENKSLANINLSSTMVSDWSDIYFSGNESAESYIIIKNDSEDQDQDLENGQVMIKTNNATTLTSPVFNRDTLISLDEYTSYKFTLDHNVYGYSSDKKIQGKDFSYPGTLRVIDDNPQKVISFMTYFENIDKESVNDVRCVGSGCLNISKLGDGIYSVTVLEHSDYKVVSNGAYCLVNRKDLEYYAGKSRCFPKIIEDDESGLQLADIGNEDDGKRYVYLGKINSELPGQLLDKLQVMGVEVVKYEFGQNNEFLFVSVPEKDEDKFDLYASSELWSELEKYATSNYEFEGYSYVY